jgi:phage shock protein C
MRKDKRDSFGKRRKRGWGMDLYRNPSESLIGGVCAGLADHWGVATWMVRLAAVALLLFTGSLAFWGYIIAWMVLSPRPTRWEHDSEDTEVTMEYDEDLHTYRKRTVFRYPDSPTDRVRKAQQRLDEALGRVESVGRDVTSRRYDLNREFSKL